MLPKKYYLDKRVLKTGKESQINNDDIIDLNQHINRVFVQAIGNGILTENITYANLVLKKSQNVLEPGKFYKITDYQTIHVIPQTEDLNTGTTEPLIVQAIANNKIAPQAYSTLYPQDIIIYSLEPSSDTRGSDTTSKGIILYREDPTNEVKVYYDYRAVKFRRWNDGSGNYIVPFDNEGLYQDLYTFGNLSTTTCVSIGTWNKGLDYPYSAYLDTGYTYSSNNLPNVVLASANSITNVHINSCYGVTIKSTSAQGAIFNNVINHANNLIIKGALSNSEIHYLNNGRIGSAISTSSSNALFIKSSSKLTAGNNFGTCVLDFADSCTFGNDCVQIHLFNTSVYTFGNDCKKILKQAGKPHTNGADMPVTFGNNNVQINIGEVVMDGVVGDDNYDLQLDGGLETFTIGTGCSHIRIESGASDITIGDNVSSVEILKNCISINIGHDSGNLFFNNSCTDITIPAESYMLDFGYSCQNIDFIIAPAGPPQNAIFANSCLTYTFDTSECHLADSTTQSHIYPNIGSGAFTSIDIINGAQVITNFS